MEAAGFFVFFHVALSIIALLLLIASIITKITNKALHMVYLMLAMLILGFSVIVTLLFSNLGGNIGLIDKLIAFGPNVIVISLLIFPIKKSLNVK